jgi:protein phosphatase
VLVGASGSGKSTFAERHFRPTEVLSSDFCRALLSDDERDQSASKDAFDVLHFIAGRRLRHGRLTVVDATNVRREDREPLLALARSYDVPAVAIVFDLPLEVCLEQSRGRDRKVSASVVRKQASDLRQGLLRVHEEGFADVHVFSSPGEIETTQMSRIEAC